MVACADMITACAETNGCMCRHDHCIRRSLHVHAMSVYSHQDMPMYMQTLLLKHMARHTQAWNLHTDQSSVGDVIYQESRLHHPHLDGLIDYITHAWIGQCANSKLVTDTGSHVTLRIHLMYSMPTFDTLSLS